MVFIDVETNDLIDKDNKKMPYIISFSAIYNFDKKFDYLVMPKD